MSLQLLPDVRHSWLVQEITEAVVLQAQRAGFQQLCPRANVATEAAVMLALDAGFTVRAWGIKTPEVCMCLACDVGCQFEHNITGVLSAMPSQQLYMPVSVVRKVEQVVHLL